MRNDMFFNNGVLSFEGIMDGIRIKTWNWMRVKLVSLALCSTTCFDDLEPCFGLFCFSCNS
ncbi:hypothetical protein GLYMA_04G140250v4 [Glycine max]|nr:hypothetical protein GLYMA_04G140250v4 [Glycine max]KAH1111281.1 hypothetical protein GYH30_009888 [Glycine max]